MRAPWRGREGTAPDAANVGSSAAPTKTSGFSAAVLARLGSIVLVIAGSILGAVAYQLPMGSLAAPGPGMWPTTAASVVVVLGLISAIHGDPNMESLSTSRTDYKRAAIAFFQVVAFAAAFWFLGYAASAFLITLVMGLTFGSTPWRRVVAISIAVAAFIHVFFAVVLQLPPPNYLF